MQNLIARVQIKHRGEYLEITGEGESPIEAVLNCIKSLHDHVIVEWRLSEAISIPWEVFTKTGMPKKAPPGQRLLILTRWSHNDGEAYDWRMFAVNADTSFKLLSGFPDYADAEEKDEDEEPSISFEAGEAPIEHSFADCNVEYEFRLPPNSKEWKDGRWIECEVARYSY